MSTIKSSAENLTLNADGANNDIKFQSNGSEVAAIDQAGNLTVSGTVDGVDVAARDGVLTSTTATAAAALPKAGGTMSGNLVVSGDIDMTGVLNGTAGSMDIKNEANNENIFLKVTGSGSEVTALKIHSNGVLELPSGGLRVGGDAAANTLDDYEEGFVSNGIANVGMPSGYTQNRYTKIGNVCTVTGQIRASSNGGGTYSVNVNLPFAAESNQTNARPFAAASLNCIGMNLDSGYNGWSGKVDPGASLCQILQHKVNADSVPFRVNQIDTNAFQLTISITYITA